MEYYKDTIARLVIVFIVCGLVLASGVVLIIDKEYLVGAIVILLSLLAGYVIFKIGE